MGAWPRGCPDLHRCTVSESAACMHACQSLKGQ